MAGSLVAQVMQAHATCVEWLARLQLRLADGMELRPHWRMDVYMPEVEGCAHGARLLRSCKLCTHGHQACQS